ncbi:MAG TPA: hypothetical protein VH309_05725 [Elusimicrobiota bacterium]|nr:hypothetical protein [Elusimicrobiota bacterium]
MSPDERLPATKADVKRILDRLDGQDGRLTSHDGHLATIGERLTSHDRHFTSIAERFDAVDKRFEAVDRRFEDVDKRFDAVDGNLRRLNLFAARTEGRLSSLEVKMDEMLTLKTDFARFQTGLDSMARQMESFERWCRSQGSMLMEHEGRIAKLESKPS